MQFRSLTVTVQRDMVLPRETAQRGTAVCGQRLIGRSWHLYGTPFTKCQSCGARYRVNDQKKTAASVVAI